MLHKTKGIVLSHLPYKETSIICQIFTEKFGLESFIENGVRTSKGKNKIALFQTLTILDMVVYQNPKTEIQRISELRCAYNTQTLYTDYRKNAMLLFMAEVLTKSLHGKETNETLFGFVENALMLFDITQEKFEDFHIHFLSQMIVYLGFGANSANGLAEQLSQNGWVINTEEKDLLGRLYQADFGARFLENKQQRNVLLNLLLRYLKIYNERFDNIRSLGILRELWV
jgi:DNA repair protein RecO (recombination protein O)